MNARVLQPQYWLLWIAVGLLTIASGCKAGVSHPPETRTTVATPVPIEAFPSAVWRDEVVTFTDPAFGLMIDVPGNWSIHPRLQEPTSPNLIDALASPCLNRGPDVLPPCTKIQLSLGPSSIRSLDEMRALANTAASTSSVIREAREINLHGLPALWFEIEDKSISEFAAVHVMILVGEQVVYLNAYGELSPVAGIVNSIRPLRDIVPSSQ